MKLAGRGHGKAVEGGAEAVGDGAGAEPEVEMVPAMMAAPVEAPAPAALPETRFSLAADAAGGAGSAAVGGGAATTSLR